MSDIDFDPPSERERDPERDRRELARWMKIPDEHRRWISQTHRSCSRLNRASPLARAEGAAADLLEALDLVIAANAQPGDGVKDGAR